MMAEIGNALPDKTIAFLLKIDELSKKQLPISEIKYLPKPIDLVKKKKLGKTIFSSIRRILWRSMCDPRSDIYKTWYGEGFGVVLNKKYFAIAVTATLSGLGIGIKLLAISATALIIKMGLEIFCDTYYPEEVMAVRNK
jgi:hypothetical protein